MLVVAVAWFRTKQGGDMLNKMIVLMLVLISFVVAQTTSTFTFQLRSKTTGKLVPGKNVDLYQNGVKLYDLTESSPGIYTNANVATGTYDVYVNSNALPDYQDIPHTGKKVKTVEDGFDSSGKLMTTGIGDSVITLSKMTKATLDYIGSGGNVTNNPDDVTLETLPGSGGSIGLKIYKTVADTNALTQLTSANKYVTINELVSGLGRGGGKLTYQASGYVPDGVKVFSANGGGTFVRDEWLYKREMNLLWTGVDNTGSLDVTTHLQKAFAALENNSTLVIPAGDYLLNASGQYAHLDNPYNNLTLDFTGSHFKSTNQSIFDMKYDDPTNNNWFTTLNSDAFPDQTGDEFKKGKDYVVIRDSLDWKNLPQWRSDGNMFIEIGGEGVSSGSYEGIPIYFSYFKKIGTEIRMYSKLPFLINMQMKTNGDLYYSATQSRYQIRVIPLSNGLKIKGWNGNSTSFRIWQYSNIEIDGFKSLNDDKYAELSDNALYIYDGFNVSISKFQVEGYRKNGSGYGIGLNNTTNTTIDGAIFIDCRHYISTNSSNHSYHETLTVNNFIAIKTPKYANISFLFGNFDTHPAFFNLKYSDGIVVGGAPVFNMRAEDITLDNIKFFGVHKIIAFSAEDLMPDGDITVSNLQIYKSEGAVVELLSNKASIRNISIKNVIYDRSNWSGPETYTSSIFSTRDVAMDISRLNINNCTFIGRSDSISVKDRPINITTAGRIKSIKIKDNDFSNCYGMGFFITSNKIDSIKITDNDFNVAEIGFEFKGNGSGSSSFGNIILERNVFENMYETFLFINSTFDNLESSFNKYYGSQEDINWTTDAIFSTASFSYDKFQNFAFAKDNFGILQLNAKNKIVIENCDFKKGSWSLYNKQKNSRPYGITAFGAFTNRNSWGSRASSASYFPSIIIKRNDYESNVSANRFLNFNDSLNVEIVDNSIVIDTTDYAYPILIYKPSPFVFKNNYYSYNGTDVVNMDRAIYIASVATGADSVVFIGNTIVDRSRAVSNSAGLKAATTNMKIVVGDNKFIGLNAKNNYGTTPIKYPVFKDELYLMGDDGVVYKIHINGGTITATTTY
jgi:hypothetical protein